MTMTSQPDLAAIARDIIDGNSYLTLATADRHGQPWPSPVWYVHMGYREFFWVSAPAARHSANLAERPQAGIVIFDSHTPVGTGQAVYLAVTAEEATGDRVAAGIAAFAARSRAQGGPSWELADVTAPARYRLYRATVSDYFLLDGRDKRLRLAGIDEAGSGGTP